MAKLVNEIPNAKKDALTQDFFVMNYFTILFI